MKWTQLISNKRFGQEHKHAERHDDRSEFKRDYDRRVNDGQDVRFTMGRRMLRICRHLIQHKQFFLPPSLVKQTDRERLKSYYSHAWKRILRIRIRSASPKHSLTSGIQAVI